MQGETHDCAVVRERSFYGCRIHDVNILVVENSDLVSRHRLDVVGVDTEHVEAHRVLADLPKQWIDAKLFVDWPLRVLQ
jgi:hypothetical protein